MAEIINVELEQEVELQTSYELSGGIIPTGTINITTNGTHDVSSFADANVNVQGGITPTGTKEIEVDAAGMITEDVTNYASVEVTVPQGQYKPNIDATPTNPSITVSNGGLITAEVQTQYVNDLLKDTFVEGYVESSDVSMKVKIGGSATQQLNTVNGQTVTPTTSTQYIAVQGDYVLGAINVAPIPSQYIIPTGTKSITANGTGIDVKNYEFVNVSVSGGYDCDYGTFTPSSNEATHTFTVSKLRKCIFVWTDTFQTTTNAINYLAGNYLFNANSGAYGYTNTNGGLSTQAGLSTQSSFGSSTIKIGAGNSARTFLSGVTYNWLAW